MLDFGKMTWEMSQQEYHDMAVSNGHTDREYNNNRHRSIIEDALSGRIGPIVHNEDGSMMIRPDHNGSVWEPYQRCAEVPASVLADYPDLAFVGPKEKEEEQEMKCQICEAKNTRFSWTDAHGIGQCIYCGTPYVILHYEGEGNDKRRVEKEPELAVKPEYVPVLQAYWNETNRIIPSGYSIPGGQELATYADHNNFCDWMAKNAEAILQKGAHP